MAMDWLAQTAGDAARLLTGEGQSVACSLPQRSGRWCFADEELPQRAAVPEASALSAATPAAQQEVFPAQPWSARQPLYTAVLIQGSLYA